MQNTSLTQSHLISTKTVCVKTLKGGKRIQKQNSRNPIPSSISPCPLQLLLLSDGSSSAVWAFVLQWRMDGEKTTVSAVYVLLLDMVKRVDGRFGFEKNLTQGSPCSDGGPVSSWGDALTRWQHPSPSCHCLHARWDVPHRRLWLSVGTYDWPLLQAQDQPPRNLSCKWKEPKFAFKIKSELCTLCKFDIMLTNICIICLWTFKRWLWITHLLKYTMQLNKQYKYIACLIKSMLSNDMQN